MSLWLSSPTYCTLLTCYALSRHKALAFKRSVIKHYFKEYLHGSGVLHTALLAISHYCTKPGVLRYFHEIVLEGISLLSRSFVCCLAWYVSPLHKIWEFKKYYETLFEGNIPSIPGVLPAVLLAMPHHCI